jgi:hypothetical protein
VPRTEKYNKEIKAGRKVESEDVIRARGWRMRIDVEQEVFR